MIARHTASLNRSTSAAVLVALVLLTCQSPALASPVRVEFRFEHATATTVNLAGDFNGWCDPGPGGIDTGIDPMSGPDEEYWWTLEKPLDPGYWEYKFVANANQWFTDPLNPRSNPGDNNNSILDVFDPLVYYVLPKSETLVATPRPEISAYLGKSDGETFDLSELQIFVDDELVAAGASYFDAAERRVSYTPTSNLANGEHEARVRIALVSGAAHADSSTFTVDADTIAPIILHEPPTGAVANAPVHIECTITDDHGVVSARIYYRTTGTGDLTPITMFEGFEDVWTGTVPAGATDAGVDLEYYLEASDLANNTHAPPVGFFAVPISADDDPPVISEAFASPAAFDPDGTDDESRLSFHLSEPAMVTVEVATEAGAHRRTLIDGAIGAGYRQAVWNGRTDQGVGVSDGLYRFHVSASDTAGNNAEEVIVDVTVDRSSEPGPIDLVLLFHANQNLNYQGDTANDVCFHGLLDVLRRHPQSKFMLHFSGTLLHDLGWFNFRHDPSTLELLQAGAADGQFEIVGSTYAQNIPYSTHMWDNDRQVEVQREVIETMVGASPTSFWNPERCWKQGLVPLIAGNGYLTTWVETHILNDSGTSVPEHALRKTRLGDQDVIVFNDDSEALMFDWVVDTGDAQAMIDYLAWLRSQDTYRDWVICYCQDAEATGLWDYEGGSDPQEDWDNLDDVLTALEATGWIRITTMSEVLEARHPSEDLTPIVDGQANWMVGPSQSAGYDDWFDFNANAPYLNQYRDFFGALRSRIQGVQALAAPGTPAANLIRHAIWNLVAHQFEFGCIGCGWWGNQDYHKAETLEGAVLAAEAALSPPDGTAIDHVDANGDGRLDWTIATVKDFYIVSEVGGRLLRWFDLFNGEEILGNEIFMWGYYYFGWREWYGGSGTNDDEHYQDDYVWNAWNYAPSAAPFTRTYKIRKHAMNDFLSIDGGDDEAFLNADYAAELRGDTLALTYSGGGLSIAKSYIARDTTLSVIYGFTNTTGQSHDYELTIENELNPSLLEVMNHGRGSLAYWDGFGTTENITPSSVGVRNTVTERTVSFAFSETPESIAGGETVHGLLYGPTFEFTLSPGQTKTIEVVLGVTATWVGPEEDPSFSLALRQNRPNPFGSGTTTIEFTLPSPGPVELAVYNLAGRKVATLADGSMEAGPQNTTWTGVDDDGREVASGVYFLRLSHGGRSVSTRIVLLR